VLVAGRDQAFLREEKGVTKAVMPKKVERRILAKKVIQWKCDGCKQTYGTRAEARDCELRHRRRDVPFIGWLRMPDCDTCPRFDKTKEVCRRYKASIRHGEVCRHHPLVQKMLQKNVLRGLPDGRAVSWDWS